MFITFEGPEGAGKSTAIRSLADRLAQQGHQVEVTREPGAGDFGRAVRTLLLQSQAMSPKAELFLFLADRAEHVQSVVRPALAQGKIVLCDRHADSTVVYQGYARGLDVSTLKNLNAIATDGLRPDLILLLDLPADVGLARITDKDRLDSEPLEFHQKVRKGFLQEAALEPERWQIIDANQAPENVSEACYQAITKRL